jgi:hypothetical protein
MLDDAFLYEFTEAIVRFPFVVRVCYDELACTIYTIIDAPEFDSNYRNPIYDVEAEIIRRYPHEMAMSFRLINIREHLENGRYSVPQDAIVLSDRLSN